MDGRLMDSEDEFGVLLAMSQQKFSIVYYKALQLSLDGLESQIQVALCLPVGVPLEKTISLEELAM